MRRANHVHTVFTRSADAPSVRNVFSPYVNATRSIEVVVVRSPGCHLCEDAIGTLDELRARFPLDVRVVESDSEEGRAIVARHRPGLSPAVLIDGRLFSSGRLPRKKLQRILEKGI
jgi:hypothetical protein